MAGGASRSISRSGKANRYNRHEGKLAQLDEGWSYRYLLIGCMHRRMMKVPPMKQLNIHEAKAKLSSLVDQAARGKSIIIAKSGTPLARLGPISEPARKIKFGFMKGEIMIADDFDAPLPEAILRAFESD